MVGDALATRVSDEWREDIDRRHRQAAGLGNPLVVAPAATERHRHDPVEVGCHGKDIEGHEDPETVRDGVEGGVFTRVNARCRAQELACCPFLVQPQVRIDACRVRTARPCATGRIVKAPRDAVVRLIGKRRRGELQSKVSELTVRVDRSPKKVRGCERDVALLIHGRVGA